MRIPENCKYKQIGRENSNTHICCLAIDLLAMRPWTQKTNAGLLLSVSEGLTFREIPPSCSR